MPELDHAAWNGVPRPVITLALITVPPDVYRLMLLPLMLVRTI